MTLNKAIYVGFSILDLSKYLIHEFNYEYIKSKYDAKLVHTDTDSLVDEIKTEDVHEDFYHDKNMFDFSEYSLQSKFFDLVNKKVIAKMKDEFKGRIISEFIRLKSKMYSLISVDDEEVTKAKEVNKEIRHKEFVDVLFDKKAIRHNMKKFKVNCTELELMMFARFRCLVLLIKDIY